MPQPHSTIQLPLEILRFIPKKGAITAEQVHQKLSELGIKRELRTNSTPNEKALRAI